MTETDETCWQVWREFNKTTASSPSSENLLEMIESAIVAYPQYAAVQGTDRTLSYADLGKEADRVTAFLRNAGVSAGSIVAVTASATTFPYIAILGALRAGCGYLPVDTSHPIDRLRYMLEDANTAALLARAEDVSGLEGAYPPDMTRAVLDGPSPAGWHPLNGNETDRAVPALSSAYVIYTSGTTGKPKGVRISQDALLNFVHWFINRHDLRAQDRVAQVAPLTFDPSVQQIFPAWATGSCLIPVPIDELHDPTALLHWLAVERITHVDLVTSHWHQMREAASAWKSRCSLPDLRWIIIGGETMYYHESHDWYSLVDSPAILNNIYGPTEATVNATEWEIDRFRTQGQIPIGVPLPNYRLYVVHGDKFCGLGETGELVIAGDGLADCYQSAEATARAFGPLDLPDGERERVYHTGDLARLIIEPSGKTVLEFRGRTDTQVKIRGYRVELEEVEAAVRTFPGVSNAAVMARGEPAQQLACFSTGPRELFSEQIRNYLATRIPDYMVPNLYLWLPEFPVTRNGKLDRSALMATLNVHLASRTTQPGTRPCTQTERTVAQAWERVLDLPEIGLDEDFFALGGTSLLAASAVNLLRRAGLKISVRDLYHSPTVRLLSAELDTVPHAHDSSVS